jgi:hypothetical protein
MTDAEVRRLRTQHVEAIRMLGESEDLVAHMQTHCAAIPHSILGQMALAFGRLALWMATEMEAEAREKARATYPQPRHLQASAEKDTTS